MYLDIQEKTDLESKSTEIAELFKESFGRDMSQAEWRWFYLDNPNGAAYVSLFYEHDQLLGHYAVIPTRLTYEGQSIIGYRSMTTMVHPKGRGRGLFTELANRVFDRLIADGAAMVYGFPNSNSAHGFQKHLGWTVMPTDQVIDVRGSDLLANRGLCEAIIQTGELAWDINDQAQYKWRTQRPDAVFTLAPGLVTKNHAGIENILHLNKEGIAHIKPNSMYRTLAPMTANLESAGATPVFEHQFGYRYFRPELSNKNIKVELIMSDVF